VLANDWLPIDSPVASGADNKRPPRIMINYPSLAGETRILQKTSEPTPFYLSLSLSLAPKIGTSNGHLQSPNSIRGSKLQFVSIKFPFQLALERAFELKNWPTFSAP